MQTGNLLFTIGCPRSGKSTYCEDWAKKFPKRVIVSSDNIRLALHGQRYEPLAETMVFAIKHVMIRAHISRGFDVIVDGTHSTEISIQRLLEIDANARPIFINTTTEVCKERAIVTGQSDLIPVIDRIYGNVQKIKEVGIEAYISKIIEKINQRGLYEARRTI